MSKSDVMATFWEMCRSGQWLNWKIEHWELQYQQLPDRSFQEGWKSWCIKVITIPAKIQQSVAKKRCVKMIVRVLPRHVLQYLGPRPAGCTCRLLGGSK